jgi:hypothetical protein
MFHKEIILMTDTNNGRGLNKIIITAVIATLISSGGTAIFTLNSSNSQRDTNIVALQTTVKDMDTRLTREHDDEVKQLAELESQLRQVQIDTARISQKVGVSASPGLR